MAAVSPSPNPGQLFVEAESSSGRISGMETALEMPTPRQILQNISKLLPENAIWTDVESEVALMGTVLRQMGTRSATITHEEL